MVSIICKQCSVLYTERCNYAKSLSQPRRDEYTYFIGPIRHLIETQHDDLCFHGYISGIVSGKNPKLRKAWHAGEFCENYFCYNNSGIYMSFLNRTHPIADDLRVHFSIINMCFSCEITSNQTKFVNLIERGQCIPEIPKTNCGDKPQEILPVYNSINDFACYDWKYRRYYGRNDVISTVLMRIFVYYGNLVLIGTIGPLFFFTLFFVGLPAIVLTLHDLDRMSLVYDVNSRLWPQV